MIEYRIDDRALSASAFVAFAAKIWPGNYDVDKTQRALARSRFTRKTDVKKGCDPTR